MRRTAAALFIASLMLSTSALASGYGLRDVSAATLGVSYAGDAANGEKASTLAFNPANLADVGTFDVAFSNVGLLPQTGGDFTATTAAGTPVVGDAHSTDIVNTALIPGFAVRYRISDQFTAGLTMTAPWGMVTDYGPTARTRYYNMQSDVKTFNAMPMVAWQTKGIAIGVGLQVQYIKGRLSKAIDFGTIGALYHIPGSVPGGRDGYVTLKAQDWSYGWVIGAKFDLSQNFTIGFSYRSEVENTLKGTESFTMDTTGIGTILRGATGAFVDGPATAQFNNPSIVTFGAKYKVDDQLTLLVGGDWTGWDTFQSLIAHSSNAHQPDDVTMMSWQNSLFITLGAEYKVCPDWTLRMGAAFDETPTTSPRRTPGIPDGSRYWVSLGVGYKLTDQIDLDASVARLTAQKGKIALSVADTGNAMRGSLTGSVSMAVTLIGLELNYHL